MKQTTVMVVDDDQDDIDLFIEVLKEISHQFRIITAHDGQEALNLLRSGSDVHHIFLDINMPIMNGIEFLEEYVSRVKNKVSPEITIYTTSSKTSVGIDRCLALGASYLQKPTSYTALLSALKQKLS